MKIAKVVTSQSWWALAHICWLITITAQASSDTHIQYISHFGRGLLSMFRGQEHSAVESFELALEQEADHFQLYHYLGWAHSELKNWQKSIVIYQKSLKLNPNNAEVLYSLGTAHFELGDWPATVEATNRALALIPDHARALNLLGRASSN
jgi:tetratricopeptide (TPR) repeat protein